MFGRTLTNAFVMLKATFSKYHLIKISITQVYIKSEVDTKIIQQQWEQPQMKPVGSLGRKVIFDKGRSKFIKSNFSGKENE